jgi:hypothetical protein
MGLTAIFVIAVVVLLIAYIMFKMVIWTGVLIASIMAILSICFIYIAGAATFATTIGIYYFLGNNYTFLSIISGIIVGMITFYLLLRGTYRDISSKFKNKKQ